VSTVRALKQFVLRVLGVKKIRGRARVRGRAWISVGVGVGLEFRV
jgi:hypothetical protein